MRATMSLCIALLPLAALHAQDKPAAPPPAAVQPAPPTGELTGTVLCSDTHRPARGAIVMVSALPSADAKHPTRGSQQTSRVSMDGTYTVKHLPPGEYGVLAFLPGYLSAFDGLTASDLDDHPAEKEREIMSQNGVATIAPGGAATLDITLQRGATINGRVLYSDGSPATQVTISLEDVNAKPAKNSSARDNIDVGSYMRMLFTHQTQGTDDQGHFRIAGIKSGSYRVAAIQSAPSNSDRGEGAEMEMLLGAIVDPGALHVYSQDTLHKKSAKVYDLRPGDEVTGIDLTIPLDAFHRILSAKDGRPINSGSLTLTDTADDSFTFTTTVADDGSFAFTTVPAGTYTLSAANAQIQAPEPNTPADVPLQYAPKHTTNTFAAGSTSILVKDSDIDDASLTLTEIPMPPETHNSDAPPPPPPAPE
jgi:hypothetical protein